MARLKVDIQTMSSASKTLKEVSQELGEIIVEYNSVVNTLASTWDGAASDEFIRRLKTQVKELKQAKKTIDGLQDYSGDVASTMKRIDKILTQILKGFITV